MISRRTALSLAEAYAQAFFYCHKPAFPSGSQRNYALDTAELYDFLFSCNYSAWLCNKARQTRGSGTTVSTATRPLKDLLMRLHTGETLFDVTSAWTWPQREQLGQKYLQDLATDILNKWHTEWKDPRCTAGPHIDDEIENLTKNLELDGYVYESNRLLAPESDILDVKEESGLLEGLHVELGLGDQEVAFHHLRLSEEHYLNSKWDDSISNSRKFLESILRQVATAHSTRIRRSALSDSYLSRPVSVREYLEQEGLLESKEKEALASVYGLLSETGSHPYMAQSDQARLLRHLSLTFAQFVMLRLKGALSKVA